MDLFASALQLVGVGCLIGAAVWAGPVAMLALGGLMLIAAGFAVDRRAKPDT